MTQELVVEKSGDLIPQSKARKSQNMHNSGFYVLLPVLALLSFSGCTLTPPTIAHTHIGHAITAFDGAPGDEGLFVVVEQRTEEVAQLSKALVSGEQDLKVAVAGELGDLLSTDNYGLRRALIEAEEHIRFAGESDDASANVREGARRFSEATSGIVRKCDLATLLTGEYIRSEDEADRELLAGKIAQLVGDIQQGSTQDGQVGVRQLREMLDAMVSNERPPYVTVDRYWLFNLLRRQDCENNCWFWEKSDRRGGGIDY